MGHRVNARVRVPLMVGLSLPVLTMGCAPQVKLAALPTVASQDWGAAPSRPSPDIDTKMAWTAFGSTKLDQLIHAADANNADVAIAAARIEQARAVLGAARAASGPQIGAFGGFDGSSLAGRNVSNTGKTYGNVGIDISYDVDLFGADRGNRRAARARLAASGFAQQAVKVVVDADVATAYIQLAGLSDRIIALQEFLARARDLERIVRLRANAGVVSQADLALQVTEANGVETKLSTLIEARENARNALAVLSGREAPGFDLPAASLAELTVPLFPTAQPAELLVRRPDLRAGEYGVLAAEGDIANLRAAFYPKLRISAAGLLDGAGPGGLLQLGLSAGASLLAPIFDNGRRRNDLFKATAVQHEAVETYRMSVLRALAETENALVAERQSAAREDLTQRSIDQAQKAASIVMAQYREGAVDFATVLNAERRLLEVREALLVTRQERLLAAVGLFRAMGGAPSAT